MENDKICMLPKGKEDKDEIQPLLSGPATPGGPYVQVSPKSLDVSCAKESDSGFPTGPALKGTQPDRSLLYSNTRASCPCLRHWQILGGLDPCPAIGNHHWQHGSSHHLQEHHIPETAVEKRLVGGGTCYGAGVSVGRTCPWRNTQSLARPRAPGELGP